MLEPNPSPRSAPRRLLGASPFLGQRVARLALRFPQAARRAGLMPPDFDWRAYLDRYPDLEQAGIASEVEALRHWLCFGAGEGRWATPPSYPTRDTLVCPSVHSLYLRATGDLVCWDDAGNDQVLQRFDDGVDYGRDVYLGPIFNTVRSSLHAGRMPFEVCRSCLVLRCRTPHSSYHVDQRVIEIFQVEPSYRCTLDCPGCVPLAIRRGAPPQNLEPQILGKILDDLRRAGITVRAFDFQGHGEPLLHPGLWQLTRRVREAFPESYLTVTTNAHGVVRDAALASGIDEVICAIDGVDQETYAPYRVHGRFDVAFRFLADFARRSQERQAGIKVIWKYVLFAHNSDPEHLLRAQVLARDAAVDELVFVFTRNGPRSTTVNSPTDVPRLTGGPAMSFRYHEPANDDLISRLVEAEKSLRLGNPGRAAELAESVAMNLERFVTGPGDLAEEHLPLLEELEFLAPYLPEATAATIRRIVLHLRH